MTYLCAESRSYQNQLARPATYCGIVANPEGGHFCMCRCISASSLRKVDDAKCGDFESFESDDLTLCEGHLGFSLSETSERIKPALLAIERQIEENCE